MMKLYLVEGKEEMGKTEFACLLADKISKNNKTLLIGTKRSETFNIEDFYKKDGMITYDICDYFLEYADLKTIINKETDKLDFIISPLVNGKYQINKEDIDKLLANLSYDCVIFVGLDKSFLKESTSILLVGENDLDQVIESDYFFINKAREDFDPRFLKEEISSKDSLYLGYVNDRGSYNNILDNLLKGQAEEIGNIGFFEKLKMKFKS